MFLNCVILIIYTHVPNFKECIFIILAKIKIIILSYIFAIFKTIYSVVGTHICKNTFVEIIKTKLWKDKFGDSLSEKERAWQMGTYWWDKIITDILEPSKLKLLFFGPSRPEVKNA